MRRSLVWLTCLIALSGMGCAPEGPTAFVDYNMAVDGMCTVDSDSDTYLPIGQYDIAPAGSGNSTGSTPCRNSYIVNLRVNSFLRSNSDNELGRAEPNILQIDSAEVKLMTLNKETLSFPSASLPNPFRVVTAATINPSSGSEPGKGLATVEAIPYEYADNLSMFDGSKILIEIQLFGKTTGDVDIEMKPFTYSVDICDGCNTWCSFADIKNDPEVILEDVVGDQCTAQSLGGSDGRVCIDPDC